MGVKHEVIAPTKAQRAAIRAAEKEISDAQKAAADVIRAAKLAAETSWDPSRLNPPEKAAARAKRKRGRARDLVAPTDEQLIRSVVPREARRQGAHEVARIPGPTIVVKGQEQLTTMRVIMNRGGTAVDRWIVADERRSSDRLFERPQQDAIRFCRALWSRAESLQAIDLTADRVDAPLGWSQHEALAELAQLKERVPRAYWEVFENVCRFDEEAGTAGSRLASNSRSAIDAAKTCVAFTASLVAMWKGF